MRRGVVGLVAVVGGVVGGLSGAVGVRAAGATCTISGTLPTPAPWSGSGQVFNNAGTVSNTLTCSGVAGNVNEIDAWVQDASGGNWLFYFSPSTYGPVPSAGIPVGGGAGFSSALDYWGPETCTDVTGTGTSCSAGDAVVWDASWNTAVVGTASGGATAGAAPTGMASFLGSALALLPGFLVDLLALLAGITAVVGSGWLFARAVHWVARQVGAAAR